MSATPSTIEDAQVTRWDRPRWISVFSSHNPTIREVTECLGLGLSASSSTTNRGIPKFDNPEYRKLSSEVTRLSKGLPQERDALLDYAVDPQSLDAELETLLTSFGPAIWGRDADRTCLLTPDPAKKTYTKHLYFDDPEDKEIIKIQLQRWIIIKACYYIRNMKLKRSSTATDFDALADIEGDVDPLSPAKLQPSPNDTPKSLSPSAEGGTTSAGVELLTKPTNSKKRKSSVFNSQSDGEDAGSPFAKRQYQSHTLPKSKNSPRKSLQSIAGSPAIENTPPVRILAQSPHSILQPKIESASTAETGRSLLTPLSSNDLNGTARPPSTTVPGSGFTPVNTGASAAVNPYLPSKELTSQASTPAPVNNQTYASPYNANGRDTHPVQNTNLQPRAPPLNTSVTGHGFQAINSPAVANGANGQSARNSPVAHHNPHTLHSSHQQQTPIRGGSISRSNTPVHHHHHHHRPSLAPQRSSRSNTPNASASSAYPVMSAQMVPTSSSLGAAPAVQPAPASHGYSSAAPRASHVAGPQNPASGAVHYAPPVQAVLKSHPVESSAMTPMIQHAYGSVDLSLLQCEVLGYFMQYLFPKPGSPPDEALLLHKMEALWHHGTSLFRHQVGSLYDLQTKILFSWVSERRMLAQLRLTMKYKPGAPAAEMVDRLLLINDLRVMRLKWKNMSSAEGLSSEDLLCRTFAVMTNTEGTEDLFKDGLDRLNEGVFDYLRSEDMRILMHKR